MYHQHIVQSLYTDLKSFLLVFVSFDPTSYTVTEGEDGAAELILVRSGDLSRATVVTVTTADGSAIGMLYIV